MPTKTTTKGKEAPSHAQSHEKTPTTKPSAVAKKTKSPTKTKDEAKEVDKEVEVEHVPPPPLVKPPPPPQPTYDITERKLHTIPIQNLPFILEAIYKNGRFTPLIIDPSQKIITYYTYSSDGLILDLKPLLVQCDVQKVLSRDEAREKIRQSLVNAMKYGKTWVLALTNTAFAFEKYFEETTIPKEALQQAGAALIKDEKKWDKVLRPDDKKPYNAFVVHPDFRVLLTTAFELEDYEEFLESALTLSDYLPIFIEPETKK